MAIVEVVKYNGGPNVFAWKYPREDLGTWTQLIVNESQEVILFKGGKALDLFTSGRYTLETMNIPLLNKVINLPFGGKSPFAAEVWYVNKLHSLDIKWGTASPIQLQDPKYNIIVPIRSFGHFGVQIEDSRKFLTKLVGTVSVFNKESITKYFRGLYLTKVKDAISTYLVHKQISVLEINAYIEEISDELKMKMEPVLSEYGIKLLNFYVNNISIPEDDTTVIKLKEALSKRAEMDIVGYNYVQERSFDTLEGAAKNTSSNQAGLMGAGVGLGMGVGIGGSFGSQMSNITKSIDPTQDLIECPNCKTKNDRSNNFCSDCGYDMKSKSTERNDLVECFSCGKPHSSDINFCPTCGKKYIPCPSCSSDLKSEDAECTKCGHINIKCPKCDHEINDSSINFCPKCGTNLKKEINTN